MLENQENPKIKRTMIQPIKGGKLIFTQKKMYITESVQGIFQEKSRKGRMQIAQTREHKVLQID